MNLSEKIYYYRKKAGLSQEELAERVGVTRQSVSKWECGSAVPELDKLAALSHTLGVTADLLISDTEPEDNADTYGESDGCETSRSESGAYPEWVNNAPSFIGGLIKRFGWLFGVYVTVIGVLFMGIGGIAKLALSRMVSMTEKFWSSVPSDMLGTDVFGEAFTAATQTSTAIADGNPVSVVASFIIILGAAIALGGIVLVAVLRRYSKK